MICRQICVTVQANRISMLRICFRKRESRFFTANFFLQVCSSFIECVLKTVSEFPPEPRPQALGEFVVTGIAKCVCFPLRSVASGTLEAEKNLLSEMLIHVSPQRNRFNGIVRVSALYHAIDSVRGELLAFSLTGEVSHSGRGFFRDVHPEQAFRVADSTLVH